MNKIIKVTWFTQMGSPQTLGIVVMHNGFELKAYLGTAGGIDEQVDIAHIINTGARIRPQQLFSIAEALTTDIEIPENTDGE